MALLDANFIQPPSKDDILSCLDTWLEAPSVRTYVFEAPSKSLDYRAGQYAMFAFSEVRGWIPHGALCLVAWSGSCLPRCKLVLWQCSPRRPAGRKGLACQVHGSSWHTWQLRRHPGNNRTGGGESNAYYMALQAELDTGQHSNSEDFDTTPFLPIISLVHAPCLQL